MGKSKEGASIEATAGFKKTTDRGKKHFNFSTKVQGSIYLTVEQLEALGIKNPDTTTLTITITAE